VKTGPHPGLEMLDVPEPVCGSLDVKVRVLRAGLCGTDLHIQDWDPWAAATLRPPLIVGHEFYGEIVEVGEDVPAGTLAVGQRISAEGHIVCGHQTPHSAVVEVVDMECSLRIGVRTVRKKSARGS